MIALNVGCGVAMDWIQTKTRLLRTLRVEEHYLVGVSGGRDSVALLHWLVNVGYQKLIVCHLNHQLRGRSSLTDARFVNKIALKYDAEFELESADVRALATKQKMSIEAAARQARYKFFAETARRRKCKTIFLAHHADDLVETFLINLFRGAGMTGLSAMREVSTRQIDDVALAIVRPFLGIWRKEIDTYVRERGLKFREDASNKNLNPLRNRIRHRIIPHLEKLLGRNVRKNLWRTAMIVGEEENWIESQLPELNQLLAAYARKNLSVEQLRALPVPLQRRAILKWLRDQKVAEIGFDVIESVRSLLDRAGCVAKVNLPQDRYARRRAGSIFLE
jgi:tRNA(Ile)-lysidine synthase